MHQIDYRRLYAGKAEIKIVAFVEAAAEGISIGVAFARKLFKLRPAGIIQPQRTGHLIERFARGVVPRAAQ